MTGQYHSKVPSYCQRYFQTGVIQFGSDADDFEFDDVGSSIEVSPTNTTSSDQQVNQVAVAG